MAPRKKMKFFCENKKCSWSKSAEFASSIPDQCPKCGATIWTNKVAL